MGLNEVMDEIYKEINNMITKIANELKPIIEKYGVKTIVLDDSTNELNTAIFVDDDTELIDIDAKAETTLDNGIYTIYHLARAQGADPAKTIENELGVKVEYCW